jgi:DNA-directed RNA polymerase specialized sigma24 family protein
MSAADVPDQLRPYARPSHVIDSGRSLERRVSIEDWVASLPDSERTIADLLTCHSEHKVAQLLGLSRRKVRDQIQRLRRSYDDRRPSGNS